MLAILGEKEINMDVGIERIKELAPGTPEDAIKHVLSEVARAKRNRSSHRILEELEKWEAIAK